jgi:flagellar basal-body rod modification protein FlgD
MINVKSGTQNWAQRPQETLSSSVDKPQVLSAPDRQAALGGDQNVGDVLNKVADPNYVDPEKTRKVGGSSLDKDAFLKLMLAQMKYQDPTNPMQNHEMAAQLAQFTSLEQLNNINSTLSGMSKSQAPTVNYQALNFIGKRVSGDSSKLTRVQGDTTHEFNFTLAGDASKAEVKVMDEEGNVVRKMAMTNLKKGTNTIKWNGIDDNGASARPGDYHFAVEASGRNGAKVFAKTEFNGKITGLNYTAQGPVLLVGQQAIRMQDVKKIEESTTENDDAAKQPSQSFPLGLKGERVEPAKDPTVKDKMATQVAMSREVMDQLEKAKGQAGL